MEEVKLIKAATVNELWQQVTEDINADKDVFGYKALLKLNETEILLEVDIDPGGGFESGYEYTRFASVIKQDDDFRLALHHRDFMDTVGKFFGMEDIEIGYPEFDKDFIIKTNDAARAKTIFSDAVTRQSLEKLQDFTLHIDHRKIHDEDKKEKFIELETDNAITEPSELRKLYDIISEILGLIKLTSV